MQIFGDITLITLLMHASGGLSSGLGLLLLVAVAATSLMLGKKLTIFYAALATLAALVEHSWGWWTRAEVNMNEIIQGYPQVGMLGIGLFATATLGYTLATRLRATEALAERRGVDLANLTQLNALVIQRLHSGVSYECRAPVPDGDRETAIRTEGRCSCSASQAGHMGDLLPAPPIPYDDGMIQGGGQ